MNSAAKTRFQHELLSEPSLVLHDSASWNPNHLPEVTCAAELEWGSSCNARFKALSKQRVLATRASSGCEKWTESPCVPLTKDTAAAGGKETQPDGACASPSRSPAVNSAEPPDGLASSRVVGHQRHAARVDAPGCALAIAMRTSCPYMGSATIFGCERKKVVKTTKKHRQCETTKSSQPTQ